MMPLGNFDNYEPKRDRHIALMIGKKIPVLDHGYVQLVDYMGGDQAVIEGARVSYGEGTKSVNDGRGLIRYLMRNYHTSPLEMAEIKVEMKMPIFVARQWVRHRTANMNEYSGRYSVMCNEVYIPSRERVKGQSKTNHQGSDGELPYEDVTAFLATLQVDCNEAFNSYDQALGANVARETARIGLPLNTYTKFVWKCDVHNLLHLIRLRDDDHAQWEVQQYAKVLKEYLRIWMPWTYEAFLDYRQNAMTFSGPELALLADMLRGGAYDPAEGSEGMSKGEMREFREKLRKLVGEE